MYDPGKFLHEKEPILSSRKIAEKIIEYLEITSVRSISNTYYGLSVRGTNHPRAHC